MGEMWKGPVVSDAAASRRASASASGGAAAEVAGAVAATCTVPVDVVEIDGGHVSMLRSPHAEAMAAAIVEQVGAS
ncbi:hypothetical protein [Rhabdothermincola salaria]|uniref:hypothetical protein n=1 Tax=Rhabdothermincola salaria TaxID=2903142 RepID=UPI001E400C34|nr:hypothetical protein [Rhabdothermincola salaria]MCD9622730.1 hypothetical protein [Rhabdothermincola salaria]